MKVMKDCFPVKFNGDKVYTSDGNELNIVRHEVEEFTSFPVKYKKLKENAKVPTFGTPDSAGADLYACIENDGSVIIPPGECKVIGTGLAIKAPKGYFGGIFARSGLSVKEGLRPANCVGVCDSDFRGEYCVALYNDSNEPKVVKSGDRIAQLIFVQCLTKVKFVESELDDTERGSGMFGSTGKK